MTHFKEEIGLLYFYNIRFYGNCHSYSASRTETLNKKFSLVFTREDTVDMPTVVTYLPAPLLPMQINVVKKQN